MMVFFISLFRGVRSEERGVRNVISGVRGEERGVGNVVSRGEG